MFLLFLLILSGQVNQCEKILLCLSLPFTVPLIGTDGRRSFCVKKTRSTWLKLSKIFFFQYSVFIQWSACNLFSQRNWSASQNYFGFGSRRQSKVSISSSLWENPKSHYSYKLQTYDCLLPLIITKNYVHNLSWFYWTEGNLLLSATKQDILTATNCPRPDRIITTFSFTKNTRIKDSLCVCFCLSWTSNYRNWNKMVQVIFKIINNWSVKFCFPLPSQWGITIMTQYWYRSSLQKLKQWNDFDETYELHILKF